MSVAVAIGALDVVVDLMVEELAGATLEDTTTEAETETGLVEVVGMTLEERGFVLVEATGARVEDERGIVLVEMTTEAETTAEEEDAVELTTGTLDDAAELEATVEDEAGRVVELVATGTEALAETLTSADEDVAIVLEAVVGTTVDVAAAELETAELETATLEEVVVGRTLDVAIALDEVVMLATALETERVEFAGATLEVVTLAGGVLSKSNISTNATFESRERLAEIQRRQSQRVQCCKSTKRRK